MASYIKTLKEDNGDITYPQTLASAVFTSGGSDVETEMSKYVTAEDIASTSALTPPVTTNMIADDAVTPAKIASSTYSTSEQVVGTWIDGEIMYRKVIEWTLTAASAGEQTKAHGISNLGNVTSLRIAFKLGWDTAWGNEQYLAKAGITFRVTDTDIVKETASASNWTGDMKIVIEYTKSS